MHEANILPPVVPSHPISQYARRLVLRPRITFLRHRDAGDDEEHGKVDNTNGEDDDQHAGNRQQDTTRSHLYANHYLGHALLPTCDLNCGT